MPSIFGNLTVFFLSVFAYVVFAAVPPTLSLNSFESQGSGCPPGAVNVEFDASGPETKINLVHFSYIVGTASWGTAICIINIRLDYPAGWSYAVNSSSYDGGKIILDREVKATHTGSFSFPGSFDQKVFSRSWAGPIAVTTESFEHSFQGGNLMWSTCNVQTALNSASHLSVQNFAWPAGNGGYIRLPFHQIKLVWKECS